MGYHCAHMNSKPFTILSFFTLVDQKGIPGTLLPPPPSIFFSFSCSSWQKSCKIIGFNPNSRVGVPRSGPKSGPSKVCKLNLMCFITMMTTKSYLGCGRFGEYWLFFTEQVFHYSIVMLWEKQSRHTRICTKISKTSTPFCAWLCELWLQVKRTQ